MSLITKLFGTYSQHQLKKVNVIADRVDALADTYAAMSNDELRGMTEKLKARYAAGETLDELLPDARYLPALHQTIQAARYVMPERSEPMVKWLDEKAAVWPTFRIGFDFA